VLVVLGGIGVASIWLTRPVAVPDVRGMVAEDANTAIKRAGLSVGEASQVATEAVSPNLIASQSPTPSTKTERGSVVHYWVAVEPSLQVIPNVVGLTEEVATERLAESLYAALPISVFDNHVQRGIVVAQTPPDQYEWTTGQPVAIAVSMGTANATAIPVPLVRDMSLKEAQSTLKNAGLKGEAITGNATATYSSDVFRQIPSPETLVPPGTTVLLVFDRL
jgi:serine/threonine-protein kinase